MPKRSPIVQKLIDQFTGLDNKKEEMSEAQAVKSGKISPKEYAQGEKMEGDKAPTKTLVNRAKKMKTGKMTPSQYANSQKGKK
jgi:hypothetical protein